MFGGLLVLLTGAYWTKEWCKDEQVEQQARKSSKEHNLPYYFDKYGRVRNTYTGRKMSGRELYEMKMAEDKRRAEEAHKYMQEKALERMRKDYDMFVVFKDKITFEEYVALRSPAIFFEKYEKFAEIKKNVPQERIDELRKRAL